MKIKKHYIIIVIFSALFPFLVQAQDFSEPEKASLSGRVIFRLTEVPDSVAVYQYQIALFPKHVLPFNTFKNAAPATFYDYIPGAFVDGKSISFLNIDPPFGELNIQNINPGQYWLCRFIPDDVNPEGDAKFRTIQPKMFIHGCQFIRLEPGEHKIQNYFADTKGFWIDDLKNQPKFNSASTNVLPSIAKQTKPPSGDNTQCGN